MAQVSTPKPLFFLVEMRGFEPLTSALRRHYCYRIHTISLIFLILTSLGGEKKVGRNCRDLVDRLAVLVLQNVLVKSQSCVCPGVPQDLGYGFQICSSLERIRRHGMPQIIEAHLARDPGFLLRGGP